MSLFGVDLGGTKIEGAVIDPSRPDSARCRLRVPTGGARGYAHVIRQVVRLVGMLERESGLKRPAWIGFGTPGVPNPITGGRLVFDARSSISTRRSICATMWA